MKTKLTALGIVGLILATGGIFYLLKNRPNVGDIGVRETLTSEASAGRQTPPKHSNKITAGENSKIGSEFQLNSSGDQYSVAILQNSYSELSILANQGDMVAARTLYRELLECQRAPRNETELRELEKKIGNPDYSYSKMPMGGHKFFEDQKSLLAHCGELTDGQFASRREWSEILAASGDKEARLEYPFVAQPPDSDIDRSDALDRWEQFRSRAKDYLNDEIAKGNTEALGVMSVGYQPSPSKDLESPLGINPQMAYQYRYAYGLDPTLDELNKKDTETVLAQLERQLTPEEVDRARKAAIEIYRKCCSR